MERLSDERLKALIEEVRGFKQAPYAARQMVVMAIEETLQYRQDPARFNQMMADCLAEVDDLMTTDLAPFKSNDGRIPYTRTGRMKAWAQNHYKHPQLGLTMRNLIQQYEILKKNNDELRQETAKLVRAMEQMDANGWVEK